MTTAIVLKFPPRLAAKSVYHTRIPPLWEMVLLLQRAMERHPERFDILDRTILFEANRVAKAAEDGPTVEHLEYLRYCANLLRKHCLLQPAPYYVEPETLNRLATPNAPETPCAP